MYVLLIKSVNVPIDKIILSYWIPVAVKAGNSSSGTIDQTVLFHYLGPIFS